MQIDLIQKWLSIATEAWPVGASSEYRRQGKSVIVAEAEDGWRRGVCSRLETANAYDFTAEAATELAANAGGRRQFLAGFQTPGKVYGADLVLGFAGVRREDLHRPFPNMSSERLLA